jgi:hypothetical protein
MIDNENEFVQKMRVWLIRYAMYLNRSRSRKGHLFTRPINRIKVTDEKYLKHLIRYIHLNPAKHGLKTSYQNHPYSSYRGLLSNESCDIISKEEVLALFNGDHLEFIDFHSSDHKNDEIDQFIIEEEK